MYIMDIQGFCSGCVGVGRADEGGGRGGGRGGGGGVRGD